eukprot:4729156-Amphidinium_carterae.1
MPALCHTCDGRAESSAKHLAVFKACCYREQSCIGGFFASTIIFATPPESYLQQTPQDKVAGSAQLDV